MTEEQYRAQQGIPTAHKFVRMNTAWETSKGFDTDTFWYDEVDAGENFVARHIATNRTSMHPPFIKFEEWEKDD